MLRLHTNLLKRIRPRHMQQNISYNRVIMAHNKFEYVRSFEIEDHLDPLHWIVLSVYCLEHQKFMTENNVNYNPEILSELMSSIGCNVMNEMKEIALGYGYSNTFHFVLKKNSQLFKRRSYKLLSNLVSLYSSLFVRKWRTFVDISLSKLPVFDGRIFLFPENQCLRDFLTKEQNNCHYINLEETTVRNLVHIAKLSTADAIKEAKNANESQKNEMLFSLCHVNYNNEPAKNKKGTIILRGSDPCEKNNYSSAWDNSMSQSVYLVHQDFIKDEFWNLHFPLDQKTIKSVKFNNLPLFQKQNKILPHTFLLVRIDGKGFHKFSELHNFEKPNDIRSLNLMTHAAKVVMKSFSNIKISYGQSDEYSFIIKRFGHREKDGFSLISRIVSIFSGAFTNYWKDYFNESLLKCNPAFDARLVLYPTVDSVRDYLSWRQADCHINNMYNTCFWKLVIDKNLSRKKAEELLRGTFSNDKIKLLKENFNFDYANDNSLFRKGTTVYREANSDIGGELIVSHCDIIGPQFWQENPHLLLEEKR